MCMHMYIYIYIYICIYVCMDERRARGRAPRGVEVGAGPRAFRPGRSQGRAITISTTIIIVTIITMITIISVRIITIVTVDMVTITITISIIMSVTIVWGGAEWRCPSER